MLTGSVLTCLANAVWQVTLIAVVAAACGRLHRPMTARRRHGLYVSALVASVTVPLVCLVTEGLSRRSLLLRSVHSVGPITPGGDGRSVQLAPSAASALLVFAGLCVAWRLLRLARAAWNTRTIAQLPFELLQGDAATLTARTARILGVTRYRVVAAAVPGPLTFGLVHPTIVLPVALTEAGAADLLAAAVGHELAHVRRRDFLGNLLLEVLISPLAFHPGIWFLKRRVDETRELACDELVAELLVERRVYARCLVHLAVAALGSGPHGYALGAVAPPLLDERVRRLIDAPATQRRLPLAFAAAMLALVTVTSARWAFAFSLATLPSAPVSTSTPVDWFMEGIAACDSGDTAGADEAYDHLIELDRAALAARCSADGLGHCTAGFARHDP